jgi:organic hydroperoxide reductase OsmC/OhrA
VPRMHSYDISVAWTGNRGTGTSGCRAYERDHDVSADGLPTIAGSSDPAFRGDPGRWNPELELTAALSQCHMLWYLHLCAAAGVTVTGYTDDAHGVMTESADGSGYFTEVVLRPQVTVASQDMIERATDLHRDAHAKCFIANSVNFPVRHEPVVAADGELADRQATAELALRHLAGQPMSRTEALAMRGAQAIDEPADDARPRGAG